VIEVNSLLGDQPELINEQPYGEGWLWRMRVTNPADLGSLLDAAGYAAVIAEH
jgi:glycine cleavage system H protein